MSDPNEKIHSTPRTSGAGRCVRHRALSVKVFSILSLRRNGKSRRLPKMRPPQRRQPRSRTYSR